MKLNHLNLTVTDVQATRRFLEKYFGMKSFKGTTEEAAFLALHDGHGFTLTLMQQTGSKELHYPATFHIGFLGQDAEIIYRELKADGYEVKPPGHYREGELYFTTPWGFTVQVG